MEEEPQPNQEDDPPPKPFKDYHSNVDTSRAFSSVREAVAVFGERILFPHRDVQTLHSTKPKSPIIVRPNNFSQAASSLPPSPKPLSLTRSPQPQDTQHDFLDVLKKLEAELKETRTELKMLKERESETEVALASLNAELHKNMSKMAKAEADAAGKSAEAKMVSFEMKNDGSLTKDREIGVAKKEEERRKELMMRLESEYPTLAQILDDNNKGEIEAKKRTTMMAKKKKKKKKPIVPLVGDFFFKKKEYSGEISGTLFTGSSGLRF